MFVGRIDLCWERYSLFKVIALRLFVSAYFHFIVTIESRAEQQKELFLARVLCSGILYQVGSIPVSLGALHSGP